MKFFNKEEIDLHPCGKEYFIKRKDDNLETIMSRYDIYTKTTEPVLNFYQKIQISMRLMELWKLMK